jgi:kumamolisin
VSYTPLQLAEIYGMPQADGAGQTVAIIELGGGFGQDDLEAYFKGLGLAIPSITATGVDGGKNEPGKDPSGADIEVLLDIEVAGGVAPSADFLVYFAPNTDAGFLDAVSTAAHATPAPAAISVSWGQSEDQWSEQARSAMDEAFADAVAMGVTVIAAAGDNGSADSDSPGSRVHTDFPASSPHVLGCGGTSLRATNGQEVSETVWNDGGRGGATGGGVSDVFPLPDWQKDAGVPERESGGVGRGVPDVAAVADPQTGYQALADGKHIVVGGTSAVAPLWAALVARIVQLSGAPAGLAQAALYAGVTPGAAASHLRDITEGNNGAYAAGPGWDPCTGLGVPDADTVRAFSTGAGAGTGRVFEYAQLSLERDPDRRGSDGEWLATAYWRQGDSSTPVGSSEDGVINIVALLDQYGADGWELVGPPEVQTYLGASGQQQMEPGDWLTKRFWMRRETRAE